MNIHKSKIEWCSHTWNPVTGCLHDCHYCYARRITFRFGPRIEEWPDTKLEATGPVGEDGGGSCFIAEKPIRLTTIDGTYIRSTPYPKHFAPTLHKYTLGYPEQRKSPARIFVSSMGDLFGEWVPDEWIEQVFAACEKAPRHIYMFLTKNPQRYSKLYWAGKLPQRPNMWYGSTATTPDAPIFRVEGYKTFISIEPLLAEFPELADRNIADWIILGAMTGPGSRKNQPQRKWIEGIVESAHTAGIPVFMKDSLAPLWCLYDKDELVRQYPPEMNGGETV